MAHAVQKVERDLVFLKKNVPSGGGLHPAEAYLLVQNVEGLAAGMYLYRAQGHGLMPVDCPVAIDRDFRDVHGGSAVSSGSPDAHALVVLAPRFNRTYWKYRHHGQGVSCGDAGCRPHLSQLLYLCGHRCWPGGIRHRSHQRMPMSIVPSASRHDQ
ncbi:MAG: hypothetical protein PBU97_01315 [Stenotrophomonas maltophilia]